MSEQKKNGADPGLFQTLGSLQFGLVILITIAVVSIFGTIIPQGEPLAFYREHYNSVLNAIITIFRLDNTYRSPLFIGLLGLFGLNVILCSMLKFPSIFKRSFKPDKEPSSTFLKSLPVSAAIQDGSLADVGAAFTNAGFTLSAAGDNRLFGEKGRLGYLGAFIVHLSLLLFLAGGVASLLTGQRGHIMLTEGETTDMADVNDMLSFPLGFELTLDTFDVSFYEDFPGRPKSFMSSVTVNTPDGASFKKEIKVNSPLMINGFTVYQSSYGRVDAGAEMSADNDTARVDIRLKGAPETMPPITTIDMTVGKSFPVAGFGDTLSIRLSEIHRNFSRGGTSAGELNPAVKIDVLVKGEPRWSVYAFKNFPGMNMPMYDDLALSFAMKDIIMAESPAEPAESEERYYTVLGVVHDRGVPLIWAGGAVMMIGFVLAFYIRPRRLWVLDENGTVYIGGSVKGDADSFKTFVRETVRNIKKTGDNNA